jgi:aryl-alcohol dehydrogenase-like predicted oxidoreductase
VQRTWDVIAALTEVAAGRSASPAQVALSWLADRPAVTSVILGARTIEQLEDNLGSAGTHLSPEETELLDRASAPGTPDYPYGPGGISQRSRSLPGPRP